MNSNKKTFQITLTVTFFCLMFLMHNAGAQNIKSKHTKDEKDVKSALDNLVEGFNNRDAKSVLSSFTEDTYIINPTRGISDYKNLREGLTKAYAEPTKNSYRVLTNVEEIQTSGDLAFVRLIWLRERNTDKAIISKEKDLEIWRRESDGEWRLARGYSFYFSKDYPLMPVDKLSSSKSAASSKREIKVQVNPLRDADSIKSALDKLAASYNSRNRAAEISFYAPDALITQEGLADMTRNQMRYYLATKGLDNTEQFSMTVSYEIEEINASGDLAFARIIWLAAPNSNKTTIIGSRQLQIWQRQPDRNWKLVRGIGFELKADAAAAKAVVNPPAQSKEMQNSNELLEAAKAGDVTKIKELLRANPAIISQKDDAGVTPILAPLFRGHRGAVDALIAADPKLNLFEAACLGNEMQLREILREKPHLVAAKGFGGASALHFAAFFGNQRAVKILLDAKSSVNAVAEGIDSVTPLASAVANKNLEIARMLLEGGANANARQAGGVTPLHEAALSGQKEMAELLIGCGADVNAKDDKGRSPLDYAIEKKQENLIRLLNRK